MESKDTESMETQVVVVGAGGAGLSAAVAAMSSNLGRIPKGPDPNVCR